MIGIGIMGFRPPVPHSMRKARGFTLVEMAIVLVIIGMIVALFASVTTTLLSSQRRQTTANRLAGVDAALVQFVTQSQRLPCPALGTRASTDPLAGTEATPCASQTNGVVPWRALGLGEQDATDGWGRRITYRVNPPLTGVSGMSMYWCDPAGAAVVAAGSACTSVTTPCVGTACVSPLIFLTNKGLQVRRKDGVTIIMDPTSPAVTGAAYVLVSPGETGGGGYTNAGMLAPTTTTDGTQELKNYASLDLQPYYVDDEISDGAGASHFDDVVLRPSVLNVVTRAGLGPRAH
jgi:prepilin-type N-terminal cleavage/methylation domain-containing protein